MGFKSRDDTLLNSRNTHDRHRCLYQILMIPVPSYLCHLKHITWIDTLLALEDIHLLFKGTNLVYFFLFLFPPSTQTRCYPSHTLHYFVHNPPQAFSNTSAYSAAGQKHDTVNLKVAHEFVLFKWSPPPPALFVGLGGCSQLTTRHKLITSILCCGQCWNLPVGHNLKIHICTCCCRWL